MLGQGEKNRVVNRRLLQTIMFRLPELFDPGSDISMDSTFLVVVVVVLVFEDSF